MRTERTSSHMVTPLDLGPLLLAGKEFAIAQATKKTGEATARREITGVHTPHNIAFIRTHRGIFIIDDEGCGPSLPVDDGRENGVFYNLLIFRNFADKDGFDSSFEIEPFARQIIGAKEIAEFICDGHTKNKINLAEWVRTFGSCVESNFSMWDRMLTISNGMVYQRTAIV